jgi:mono/diheme cytochrome c family protein
MPASPTSLDFLTALLLRTPAAPIFAAMEKCVMRGRFFLGAGIVACTIGTATAAIELPAGPNRNLVYAQCRTCHDLQYLQESAGIPRDAWSDILDSMKQYGLRLSDDQRKKILDYLATYLGPNPPPATPTTTTNNAEAANGKSLFEEQCIACHQANGQGVPGQFPALAGNRDLFIDRIYPAYVVLFGLSGPITVEGKNYDGAMPPFGHLSDAQIAGVVNYVRGAWQNAKLKPAGLRPIEAAEVAAARKKPLNPAAVFAYRKQAK